MNHSKNNRRTKNLVEDYRAIDLFSGCGGLTLGLKNAGFKVLGAVEIDPLSVETYEANHQEVKVWKTDVRNLNPTDIKYKFRLLKGELDLLSGCPPCQGFSSLRTLNGSIEVDDPRNDLLFDFLRFVEVLLPRSVVMENVPKLASDSRFNTFLKVMKDLGYIGRPRILNAADYGVAQRRLRMIYIAGYKAEIPFVVKKQRKKTVKDTIGQLAKSGESNDPIHDLKENRTDRILQLIRRIPHNGGSRKDLPYEDQLECHKKCNGFKDVYGRMSWNDVAPTITSGCFNPSKGRFLHPEEDRAITMREAALLQGFPLHYKFPCIDSKSAIASMIGNAFPPPFIGPIALSIKNTIRLISKG